MQYRNPITGEWNTTRRVSVTTLRRNARRKWRRAARSAYLISSGLSPRNDRRIARHAQ